MNWWIWAIVGVGLMALELTLPTGFILVSFGLGAIVTALVASADLVPSWVEWMTFGAVSTAAVFALRAAGLGPMGGGDIHKKELSDLIGETAEALEDVPGAGPGKAELRGTVWTARSSSGTPIPRGTRCRVDRVEGIVLWLRPE